MGYHHTPYQKPHFCWLKLLFWYMCVCVQKLVYCTPQNGPIKGNYEILNQGLLQYLPVGINM